MALQSHERQLELFEKGCLSTCKNLLLDGLVIKYEHNPMAGRLGLLEHVRDPNVQNHQTGLNTSQTPGLDD
jgi:hypothetical protein